MAHYLVTARPRRQRLAELSRRLDRQEFRSLEPFGPSLTRSLERARWTPDDRAVWEEEDYCSPPLTQEREAVLDHYFDDIEVEPVKRGEGWERIRALPALFPDLARRSLGGAG